MFFKNLPTPVPAPPFKIVSNVIEVFTTFPSFNPLTTSLGIRFTGIPKVLLNLSLASYIDFIFPPVSFPIALPTNPPSAGAELFPCLCFSTA